MKLSQPVEVKILRRHDNGGGVIEIPLLPMTEIDLSRTASGSEKSVTIDAKVLEELAANFAAYPGPVPIGVSPHVDFADRGGFAPGFVNAVSVRDGALYGEVDLVAGLFAEVEAGGWRGFSVEISRNLKTATKSLSGWVLTGGVFTNRPATDTHFRIAAEDSVEADQVATFNHRLKGEEIDMAEKTANQANDVAALTANLETQKTLVASMRSKVDDMTSEKQALETRLTETNRDLQSANIALSEVKAKFAAAEEEATRSAKRIASLEREKMEAQVKLEAEENRALKARVIELVQGAIDRGVSAALFEGVDADPVTWFNKRYTNVEALEQFLDALPTVSQSATSSGKAKSDEHADLSEAEATKLRRMGLDPKFANIADENQLRDLKAEEKGQ